MIEYSDCPVVLVKDEAGKWWVETIMPGGQRSIMAPLGDGSFLLWELTQKIINPALRNKNEP